MWDKMLTVDKVKTALDLLLSQQLFINISFFSSDWRALIGGDREDLAGLICTFFLFRYFSPYVSGLNSVCKQEHDAEQCGGFVSAEAQLTLQPLECAGNTSRVTAQTAARTSLQLIITLSLYETLKSETLTQSQSCFIKFGLNFQLFVHNRNFIYCLCCWRDIHLFFFRNWLWQLSTMLHRE